MTNDDVRPSTNFTARSIRELDSVYAPAKSTCSTSVGKSMVIKADREEDNRCGWEEFSRRFPVAALQADAREAKNGI